MLKKDYLMTPGPTPVPPRVLLAEAQPMIHHRTPIYSAIFKQVLEDLQYVFQTQNDIIVFTASGTGAMESAVVNCFSQGDKVIAASNGKFGERFAQIAKTYGLDVIELKYDWGTTVKADDISRILNEQGDSVKGVLMVHSETSTGVLSDVKAISDVVRNHPALLIVDSITGLGAVELKTDEWGLDIVITGSQKGLMMPPGLACVSVSGKAWQAVEKSTLPKYYFSYQKAKKGLANKDDPQSPFTPAVSLIIALREALAMMREEGIENVIKRHALNAEAVRQGAQSMGLSLYAPPDGRGNAVTPIVAPEGMDGEAIVKKLKADHGITIAGGQDHLKGKVFRIGHLGYYDKFDVLTTLAGLEMVLSSMGFGLEPGKGLAAAEKVFLS